MIIDPKTAIEQGWITHPSCFTMEDWEKKKYISPNAIDFTLDILYTINGDNRFMISEDMKQMREGNKVNPDPGKPGSRLESDHWYLYGNSVYDGMSDMYVTLPQGVVCTLIIRSSLARNGCFLTSGLYDQGFEGNIGFVLHNKLGPAFIGTGTRIGQIVFHQSANSDVMYAGGYNTKDGQHWSDKNEEE